MLVFFSLLMRIAPVLDRRVVFLVILELFPLALLREADPDVSRP